MSWITGIVGILKSDGTRADRANYRGQHQPVILKFPTAANPQSRDRGDGTTEVSFDLTQGAIVSGRGFASIDSTGFAAASNVAELRANPQLITAGSIRLDCHTYPGCGGGDLYWDPTALGIDDNGSLFAVDGVSVGRWKRRDENGDVRNWGADPSGVVDSSAAFEAALNSGIPIYVEGTYRLLSTVHHTGKVRISGRGAYSRILCDTVAFDILLGDNSVIENLYFENITEPWIITRNPLNWTEVVTVQQSNGEGYQPTVNDADIWGTLTIGQQNQDIGPKIYFHGDATGIKISGITGRFVSIILEDATHSTISDCDIRAGKGIYGGIVFFNISGQEGIGNRAIDNRVRFASFNGICFCRNSDGAAQGNHISGVGESGIKTYQNTIGAVDARCYRMHLSGNYCEYCYYDGLDLSSDYPHTGAIETQYVIEGNSAYRNRLTGFFSDGLGNQFSGNQSSTNGASGIFLTYGDSLICGNFAAVNNNDDYPSGHHDIAVIGGGNSISQNCVRKNAAVSGSAFYLYDTSANFIAGNKATGGSITRANVYSGSTSIGNEDPSTVAIASSKPQDVRQNTSSVPALMLYNEDTGFDNIDVTFFPRRHLLTNPIARVRGLLSLGSPGAENGWLVGYAAQGGTLYPGWEIRTVNDIPGEPFVVNYTPNAEIYHTWIPNGSLSAWVNESSDQLTFVVRYSDGTGKSGTVALT